MKKIFVHLLVLCFSLSSYAQHDLGKNLKKIESKVIEWHRDFHKNPELSKGVQIVVQPSIDNLNN